MPAQSKKYIFFDTNLYRSLFSESEIFSEEVLQLVEKLVSFAGVTVLMPQQTKDEIERNIVGNWVTENNNSLGNKLKSIDEKIVKIEREYSGCSKTAIQRIKKDLENEKKKVSKKILESQKQYLAPSSKSKVKLNKLYALSSIIEETHQIKSDAYFRREKGNPPVDGEKLGDKLIWESLIAFLSLRKKEKPTLLFVSRDSTAWKSKVGNLLNFDLWLQKEYRQKCGGKVVLLEKLSDIPLLTKIEQQKIKEEEEKEYQRNIILKLKTRIPERLRNANTFAEANMIMRAVKDKLVFVDDEAVEEVIKASLENASGGSYNQVIDASYALQFFSSLLTWCIKQEFELKIWKNFYLQLDERNQERFYDIRKTLQSNGQNFELSNIKYIHDDDVPF